MGQPSVPVGLTPPEVEQPPQPVRSVGVDRLVEERGCILVDGGVVESFTDSGFRMSGPPIRGRSYQSASHTPVLLLFYFDLHSSRM